MTTDASRGSRVACPGRIPVQRLHLEGDPGSIVQATVDAALSALVSDREEVAT